jgi:S-adenosylmethionine hydrolase
VAAAELGPVFRGLVPSWVEEPRAVDGAINGVVITVDHFGNLISNIESRWIAGLVEPHVYAGNRVLPVRRTYGDARPGDFLALVNSFDVLEIARAEGSAADALGLSRGAPVVVRDAVRHS